MEGSGCTLAWQTPRAGVHLCRETAWACQHAGLEKSPETCRNRKFPSARLAAHLGLVASAVGYADARTAATRRLAVFGDGRTLRASGARPSCKGGRQARSDVRWLRSGYARKDKGLAVKLTLSFVGRPCRDRTYDQRIKRPCGSNGAVSKSTTCSACQHRNQCQQGTITAHPMRAGRSWIAVGIIEPILCCLSRARTRDLRITGKPRISAITLASHGALRARRADSSTCLISISVSV